jgi:hypothetical protein
MRKVKKPSKKTAKSLDNASGKRRRGRPGVRPSLITGTAHNYEQIFEIIWNDKRDLHGRTLRGVGHDLVKARTEKEVVRAFNPHPSYQDQFKPLAGLILKMLRDTDFPKTPKAQKRFLAESLACRGLVTPRRARDICEQERRRERTAHRILRFEWYIECSCGYKGRSRDHSCPKCGAKIDTGFGAIPSVQGYLV